MNRARRKSGRAGAPLSAPQLAGLAVYADGAEHWYYGREVHLTVMRSLKKLGYVERTAKTPKVLYRITAAGRAAYEAARGA